MKKYITICAISLLIFGCTPKMGINKLKDSKSIEGIKIGTSMQSAIDKVQKKYYVEKKEMPVSDEKHKAFEYIVYKDKGKKDALFSFNAGYDNQTQDKVFRLVIKNSMYHTIDDICIGMNVKELKEKTSLKSVDFNYDDGLFIASGKFDGGFSMEFDPVKDLKKFDFKNPKIEALPDGMKIKEIILF